MACFAAAAPRWVLVAILIPIGVCIHPSASEQGYSSGPAWHPPGISLLVVICSWTLLSKSMPQVYPYPAHIAEPLWCRHSSPGDGPHADAFLFDALTQLVDAHTVNSSKPDVLLEHLEEAFNTR